MLADLLRLAGLGQDMELFASLQVRHRPPPPQPHRQAAGQPQAGAQQLDLDLNLRINNAAQVDQAPSQLDPLDLSVSKHAASNTPSSKQVPIEQSGSSLSPLGSPSSSGSACSLAPQTSTSEVISSSSSSSSGSSSSSSCNAQLASAPWPAELADEPAASSARRRRQARSASSTTKTAGRAKGAGRAHLCLECGRSFSRSDMLTRHSRLHSGLKPYQCPRCKQVFSRSDHLSTHERTHTGEKPYRCALCSYSACRRDMITRHMRTHANGQHSGRTEPAGRKLHRRRIKTDASERACAPNNGHESSVSTSLERGQI